MNKILPAWIFHGATVKAFDGNEWRTARLSNVTSPRKDYPNGIAWAHWLDVDPTLHQGFKVTLDKVQPINNKQAVEDARKHLKNILAHPEWSIERIRREIQDCIGEIL